MEWVKERVRFMKLFLLLTALAASALRTLADDDAIPAGMDENFRHGSSYAALFADGVFRDLDQIVMREKHLTSARCFRQNALSSIFF